MCSNYCKDCVYASAFSGYDKHRKICCDYIIKTGEPRGCESGDNCTKKVAKKKRKSQIAYGKALKE